LKELKQIHPITKRSHKDETKRGCFEKQVGNL